MLPQRSVIRLLALPAFLLIFLFGLQGTSSACRMYGAISETDNLPPGVLIYDLLDAPYSLKNLADTGNIDGWGIAHCPETLFDSAFRESADDADLRADSGSGWYESRADVPDLLTLDTSDVGGNTTEKAALLNYGVSDNAYLTQMLSTPQTGTLAVSFEIYISRIEDSAGYDRSALVYLGNDSVGTNAPTGTSNERFVFLAFYDPDPENPGSPDDLEIRARTSSGQSYGTTSAWTLVEGDLSYDTWYDIRLVLDIAGGTYDIYVDGELVGDDVSGYSGYSLSEPVTHITFAADSDGRGDFYVDNVEDAIERGAERAYTDLFFEDVVDQVDLIAPNVALAHVRNCTSGCCMHGSETIEDPHPFYRYKNGKKWTFVHNGGVSISLLTSLINALDPNYLTENPLNGSDIPECLSDGVDSEYYFLYLLLQIEQNGWDVETGIVEAVLELIDNGESGMNFILSDGESVWGFRKPQLSSHTLYYIHDTTNGYSAFASEYPSGSQGDWEMIPEDYLVVLAGDAPPVVIDVYNYTPTPPEGLLVDSEFDDSVDSPDLRDNGPEQDWYESRGDDPSLLTLDASDIAGNDTAKAAFAGSTSGNAYLSQELNPAQDSLFAVEWDIYVDTIFDGGNRDRAALQMLGADLNGTQGPNSTSTERFVFLACYAEGGAAAGTMDLIAREPGDDYADSTAWRTVLSGMELDRWYGVKVVLDVAAGTYDVYVDDTLAASGVQAYAAMSEVTHISFAQWDDGAGAFFVDDVAEGTIPSASSLLADAEFDDSLDSADLRENGPDQDWYESRNDVPGLLTLHTTDIGGNDTPKARFEASSTGNAYLTQEFNPSQTGIFAASWEIYVDEILDIGDPDRAGWMLIGDNLEPDRGPNGRPANRFVQMAFAKPGGGTTGTMDLVARERNADFTEFTTIATGLPLDAWHLIEVVCNVQEGNYAVYVNGTYRATVTSYQAKSSLTHISFAQWNDGAGTFFVDNVIATADEEMLTLSISLAGAGSGLVTRDPEVPFYEPGETIVLTAEPDPGSEFADWSGDVPAGQEMDNPLTLTMDSDKEVTANFDALPTWLIFDNDFEITVDSADLRDDGPGQDWYESRNDDPGMLTLDEENIDGNDSKKAKLAGSTAGNAYLSQELTTPQAGVFCLQWDIYVDEIVNASTPDRSAYMLIGDDADGNNGPNSTNSDRFGYMAMYKEGGGTTGTMDLVARQPEDSWSGGSFTQLATGLELDRWHTIKVEIDIPNDTYDVYLNGALVAEGVAARAPKSALTHISFATWNDGPGTFYVDNVMECVQVPDLRVAPTYLDFGPDQDTLLFEIENVGDEAFDWTASADAGWIATIDPDQSAASLEPGEIVEVSVTIDRGLLGAVLPDTNCRMWGAITDFALPEEDVAFDLIDGPDSLKNLTLTSNEEGWAMGYYPEFWDVPTIVRGPVQAINDPNFDDAVADLTAASPKVAIAHVRNCTSGCCDPSGQEIDDPHPFYREKNGKTWLFVHNGAISKDLLRSLIGEDYLNANWPNGSGVEGCDPSDWNLVVDSELYFLLLLKNIEANNWSVEAGIIQTVADLQSYTANFLLTDGYTLWGYRRGHDLAFHYEEAEGYSTVASQPPNGGADWTVMSDNQLVILQPGEAPQLFDLNDYPGMSSGIINVVTSLGESVDVLATAELLPAEPTFISFSPESGASAVGVPREFSITVGHGNGVDDIEVCRLEIKDASGGGTDADTVFLEYSGVYKKVYMYNHEDGRYRGGFPGSDEIVEDSLAILDVSQTSVFEEEDTVTINWNIAPKAAFLGDKIVYLYVIDVQHNKLKDLQVGTWTVAEGETFALTIGVDPSEGGTTDPPAGTSYHTEGAVVPVSAIPNAGYRFTNWTGDLSSTDNPLLVTMTGDLNVTANFELIPPPPEYDLTVDTVGSGRVALDPPGGTYEESTVVTLTANPSSGWSFTGWAGDVTGTDNPLVVTMTSDLNVTANFEEIPPPPEYNLTVVTEGSGTVDLNPPGGTYEESTVVTLTANPSSGWSFTGWAGDVTGTDNPLVVTMTSDLNVTANFVNIPPPPQYTLTVNTAGSGTVDLNPPGGVYDEFTEVTLTADPAAGWSFTGWSGDLTGTDNPLVVTMTADRNVTATFEESGLQDVPVFVSFTPTSGSAAAGTPIAFQVTVADGNGSDDIVRCRIEIEDATGGGTDEDTVFLEYAGEYGKVYMYNHDDGRYRGDFPGSDEVVEDDLALFDLSQTSFEQNGDYLTVTYSVTPKAAFAGEKKVFLYVIDADHNKLKGLEAGTWTVLDQ